MPVLLRGTPADSRRAEDEPYAASQAHSEAGVQVRYLRDVASDEQAGQDASQEIGLAICRGL